MQTKGCLRRQPTSRESKFSSDEISGLENSEIVILGHLELSDISSVCIFRSQIRNSWIIRLQYRKDFSSDNKLPVFNLIQDDNCKHTAIVCFNSGTSGKPKGVELSHFNLIASLLGIRASDPVFYNSDNRGVFLPPLYHISGSFSFKIYPFLWNLLTLFCRTQLSCVYVMLMKQYTLNDFLRLSSKIRANSMRIVPPIALAISESQTFEDFDLSSVKHILCSGAALKEDIIDALHRRLKNAPIFQGYG